MEERSEALWQESWMMPALVVFTSLVRVASWHSDLLTFEDEEARGEFVNTVGVLSASLDTSHEESIANIHRRYRKDVADSFQKIGSVLEQDWGDHSADIDSYLDGLLSTSAGFLAWNQVTDRYVTALEGARTRT